MARILLIDDDRFIRTLVRRVLEGAGHEVLEATNGKEGIATLQVQPSDLVICDMFMPTLDGFEVLREIRRLAIDVNIIAMSGGLAKGPMDPLPMAGFLGAKRVMHKPFKATELLEAVNGLLGQV